MGTFWDKHYILGGSTNYSITNNRRERTRAEHQSVRFGFGQKNPY